jgi:SAM-dependent methyltransferase
VARLVTWSQYLESIGDRSTLFAALADAWPIGRALYPGSYVDLSPSTAFPSVVYIDSDARAGRFFADPDLVAGELADRTRPGAGREVMFLSADYTHPLDLADGSVDLLISLIGGPVWEHCARYLRPGGWLLANTSHGDASVAALDPTVRLVAAVHHRDGRYHAATDQLDRY